jgi:hypothetical protein
MIARHNPSRGSGRLGGKKPVMRTASLLIRVLALWTVLIFPAAAFALALPKGDPILEIAGQIGVTNKPGVALFDREMLEAIGMEKVVTTTPWHKGKVTFEGPSLAKLLQTVQANGSSVRVVALNDYAVTIPMDDFARHGVILAMKRNGQYMPIRDKGPLFVIYPYDSNAELKQQMYYARSAWQVKRIEVMP